MSRDHPRAVLDAERVQAIRKNRHGKSYRQLAEQYQVHINTVKRIAWHHTWKHV
jgi:transposase